MHKDLFDFLRSPINGRRLQLTSAEYEGDFVKSGILTCDSGTRYSIVDFIPRFATEGYSRNFTIQWERHPDILSQASGLTMYERRFKEETKWPDKLNEEVMLEVGCGTGGLTEAALRTGATLFSFDLSKSVELALKTAGNSSRNAFLQASVFDLPFADQTFDKIFCFGVLQHTPDPETAFYSLIQKLRPGGSIAVDSYLFPDPNLGGSHRLLRAKYRARKFCPRRNPDRLYFLVRGYVWLIWPLCRLIRRLFRNGTEMCRSLLIDDYEARLEGLDQSRFKEFAILDIFDFLSPTYDIPQTEKGVRTWFEAAGLLDIEVHPGWNGIEGRGIKP